MLSGLLVSCLLLSNCSSEPARHAAATGTATASAPAAALSPARMIRVLLVDELRTAGAVVRDSFNLVDSRTGEVLRTHLPAGEIPVAFTSAGIDFPTLNYLATRPAVDILPLGEQPVQIRLTGDWRDFRGGIRLLKRPDGGAVLNLVDIEDYLAVVVSSELPAGFQRETFRAQAIAARTYAWYARQTSGQRRDWDVWANEKSQVYGGLERQRLVPRAVEAVRDTRGIVCTWASPAGQKIFCTYFGSRCGGTTVAASDPSGGAPIPPLAGGVSCEFCRRADAYRWPGEPRFTKIQIGERLAGRYQRFAGFGPAERVEVVEATDDGRALRVALTNAEGRSLEIEGENFRLTLDPTGRVIRSTIFTPVDDGDSIVFTQGRGMGHGMGMCQYGAEAMAQAGQDAAAILRHYYPESRLTRAY